LDTSRSPLTPIQRDVLTALAGAPGFYLSGGAALSLAYLQHRQSLDIDLFTESVELVPRIVAEVEHVASAKGWACKREQTFTSFCRLVVTRGDESTLVDVVHDSARPLVALEGKPTALGVPTDDLDDLIVNKLCAILGRGDVKDLVDLYFLDQAGHDPLEWLDRARQKDGGLDPTTLAWVLKDVSIDVSRLLLLKPLTSADLGRFRDGLVDRLVRGAWPRSEARNGDGV